MVDGLVGATGFVGGNLARQRDFPLTYRSSTIGRIDGQHFTRLFLAGAPAQKWAANADPDGDGASLDGLMSRLATTTAEVAVLVSTVDVYPDPAGVDEDTPVSPADHTQAYGRNRLRLERFVAGHYPRTLVLRLPALFGPGLKKNLVFDLMHGRTEEFCHRGSTFQFYDLRRLADDVDTALIAGLTVLNLATEPVSAQEVATRVFGRELTDTTAARVAYDMQTRHGAVFGAPGRYVAGREAVLAALTGFVHEQWSRS